MDNNIDDMIVISSDDDHSAGDVGTVAVSNSRTVIEALVHTFYRTRRYVNGYVISSSVSMERQYYQYGSSTEQGVITPPAIFLTYRFLSNPGHLSK